MISRTSLLFALLAVAAAAAPQLSVVAPTLYQYDGGPPLGTDALFNPGDQVFFSFQVQGYKATEERKVDLQYRVEAVDPGGTLVAEPVEGEVKTELAPQDKDWQPKVRQSVPAPPLGVPGTFRIRIVVKDLVGGAEAKLEIPFRVGGRAVAPSDTLLVRNFRFLKNEEDRGPLTAAIYHPGETLWARFEIVGYKLGEKNHIHVEYGLSVLGPTGKNLYSEPRAAVEDTSSFYPKRYLPGSLSLNLQANAQRGEYTIVLTVRDEVGSQTFEEKHPFKIE